MPHTENLDSCGMKGRKENATYLPFLGEEESNL